MRRNTSILELSFSCILEIQPERSEQTLDGMKWSPEWLDFYDFTDSRIGFVCVELPEIVSYAERLLMISAVPPAYTHSQFEISSSAARSILLDYNSNNGMKYLTAEVLKQLSL